MNLRLVYVPAPTTAAPVSDPDDAVYALGAAGAAAAVELGDQYRLLLDGATGLAELHMQVVGLLDVLRTGKQAWGEDRLRADLPDMPATAVIHSWHFPSYMVRMPVIVFAIDVAVTHVYTRTLSEGQRHPLVVGEGRDLGDAVEIQTAALLQEAEGFLDQVDRDIARK